jgi:eukaryotic-like serine/threonine-protein kinase
MSAADPLETLRASLSGEYAIERLLGQGGMGAVYLARDVRLDRPVAIKVISPEVGANEAVRERFLQEARAVARLRHPNIVSVYAAGESGGLAYFAMEFIPGESLRDLLTRETTLGGERAEQILREIALALDYAHAQGLIHRDVKPENILLDRESGRAMLTDFGVARAFEKDGGLTQTGMILGSPRYMSPEQASGDRDIDGRVDIYALALVGYELYTGAPVVQGATVASMLVKHLTETPVPLRDKAVNVPAHVAAAIDRGLEKDPDHRWQRGREFAEAIAGASLTPTGEVRRAAPGVKRPSRRIPLVVGAGLAVAAAAGWFAFGRGSGSEGSAYLVTPFEVQSGDATVRWLREGSVNMLTLTLGQWSDLNVINYERTLSLLDAAGLADKERLSLEDARSLARRAEAGTVVTGQVQTTRDSLIVVARLFDVRTGRPIQQAQRGTVLGDDPRPLYDRLAQDLLAIAGGPSSGVQLSQATTTSLEAYRAYLEGVKLLNSWKLTEADTAFGRAVTLDSTFALAWHKRSLGLGWSQVGGPLYSMSSERAFGLAQRLPPRERALVEGHYHLVKGLAAANSNTPTRPSFNAAIATFSALVARDSLVAEAWYGLADSYFHARSRDLPRDSILPYMTRAVRGFNRTLAVDSTFHLAYSHLVQLYNQAASNSDVVFLNDSAVQVSDPASPLTAALRDSARARGLEIARAWVRADEGSAQSTLQLAQSFGAAGMRDSAVAVLRAGISRSLSGSPTIRMNLLQMQVQDGDTGVLSNLQYVLDHYTPDTLRTISIGQRFNALGFMASAAAVTGNSADVDRAVDLFAATDPTLPFSATSTAPVMTLSRRMLGIALGEAVTGETARQLRATMSAMDTMPLPAGQQMREGSVGLALLAFLSTRDTVFAGFVRKWSNSPWPDLDALIALDRGDTATAQRIAATFPTPDSLRNPAVRFGVGGIRSLARAEALARLGLHRQAAESYEAIEPSRVNRAALAEPGYAMIVRSLLTRARLWREVGEREKAIAAYEEFLLRWRNADGVAARQVAEARQELASLRDVAPVRTP